MKYSVYYSGGSGGYMFYHGLNILLGTGIDVTWPSGDNYSNWKTYETLVPESDINLYCNQFNRIIDESIAILLYTDQELQIELAYLKKAYWFNHSYQTPINDSVMDWYRNIKDSSWSTVNNISEFKFLDDTIITELQNDFGMPSEFEHEINWEQVIHKLRETIPGTNILYDLKNILNDVDYKFKLQDVVRTKFKCVSDVLNLPHIVEVEEHVDMWVNLHPEEIQEMLLK